jgi:hypothetical protein
VTLRFFKLSCRGGIERRRWIVKPPWDFKFEWKLQNGGILETWEEVAVQGRQAELLDDMPWSLDSNFFVSDRFREFLEAEVPGHAQFLPVRMEGPGVDEAHRRYWAVNWLHLLDCIDLPRSMDEGTAGPWMPTVVIDPARIPPDILVGRLKHRLVTTIIRGDLVKKIKKAKFTGPQFYEVWLSTDQDAPGPIWKPGVKRDKNSMPWPETEHEAE